MVDSNLAKEERLNPGGNERENHFVERVEKAFVNYGLLPQTPAEAADALKIDRKKLMEALNYLRRLGRLIRINADIYIHQQTIDHLINVLHDFFTRKEILTPQDFKDMFGVSRKYGIPLLEHLDRINFTVRVAEGRKLCRKKDSIKYGECQ